MWKLLSLYLKREDKPYIFTANLQYAEVIIKDLTVYLSMVLNASYSYRIDRGYCYLFDSGLKLIKLALLTGCQKCKNIYASHDS